MFFVLVFFGRCVNRPAGPLRWAFAVLFLMHLMPFLSSFHSFFSPSGHSFRLLLKLCASGNRRWLGDLCLRPRACTQVSQCETLFFSLFPGASLHLSLNVCCSYPDACSSDAAGSSASRFHPIFRLLNQQFGGVPGSSRSPEALRLIHSDTAARDLKDYTVGPGKTVCPACFSWSWGCGDGEILLLQRFRLRMRTVYRHLLSSSVLLCLMLKVHSVGFDHPNAGVY